MSEYYMLRDNQTAGPHRADEIRAWASAGQLAATDLFAPVGGQQWAPLAQWPELAGAPGVSNLSTGLSAWITRGWETVTADPAAFILGMLIVVGLTIVTLGICGPPLSAGIYIMAMRKHDGRPVRAGDVMEGFQYFGATWGLTLIILVPVMLAMGLIFGVAFLAGGGGDMEEALPFLQLAIQLPASALSYLIGTAMMFAIPLIVDRNYGSIQALQESWEAVKPQFWSYLGTFIIFSLIGGAGAIVCYVGILFTQPLFVACVIALYRSRFPAKA